MAMVTTWIDRQHVEDFTKAAPYLLSSLGFDLLGGEMIQGVQFISK